VRNEEGVMPPQDGGEAGGGMSGRHLFAVRVLRPVRNHKAATHKTSPWPASKYGALTGMRAAIQKTQAASEEGRRSTG